MNIYKEMWHISNTLEKMKNYNSERFVEELKDLVGQLNFFYDFLVEKQGGDSSKTFYQIKPSKRPREGQVAYFKLGRGFPKELYDAHYCYILKDYKVKYIVIPMTSVKDDSEPDPKFEFDITTKNFINNLKSRLHIDEIRTVDIQRLVQDKGSYNIVEEKIFIENKVKELLFG